ncbi:TonB-dependent receptor [Chloracidobacterium sp. D]|uniref:TonB-dependent receptor n=1 Tax=Chloracidobacterium sp. D TaxID=2821536 RepID=UPI001B8D091D|nr:TonB-dependent receptor [Chloracidobacterium sp. D]QUV83145.1 TonB-dependent receptor [Chloracidobacterium sp. D]
MVERIRVWFGRRLWAVAAVIWLCSFMWSLTILAGPTGTITGVVRDSGGAFISGAEVSATNLATNFTRTAITNASGRYVIAELLPGDYQLEVKRDGFQTAVETRVVVNVEAIVAKDFTLVAGAISETITVESDSDLVNRESGAVGTVIERKFVENLPLNGRSFQALIELTPGVVLARPSIFSTGQFSINGQRTNANYFMVDGVSANFGAAVTAQSFQQGAGTQPALTILGTTSSLVPADAMQEFRVQTSSFAAEYGRTPGGQISISTRSGSNDFTGSLFHYFRNEKLDANDWFNNRNGLPRLPLRLNQFGGTFGGPIRIPGLYDGRNRSFFFATYEGLRLLVPGTVFVARVPSLAARQAAPEPFRAVLNAFPLPNAPAQPGDPADAARYITGISDPSEIDTVNLRFDQKFGQSANLFFTFLNSPSGSRFRSFPSQENAFERNNRSLTGGLTWAIRPNLVLDTRLNFGRSRGNFDFRGVERDGAVLPPDSLVFPSFAPRATTAVSLQTIPGVSGVSAANLTQGRTLGQLQRQFNLVSSVTYVVGNHEIKVGADYRLLRPIQDTRSLSISYVFGTVASRATGVPTSISIQAFAPVTGFRIHNFSSFVQDTWRIRPRLTLTFGLRHDLNPPLAGERLPFSIDGLENPLTARLAPAGTRQWRTRYTDFAPRLGVAYQFAEQSGSALGRFFGGWILRGGYGIFYDLGTGTALRGFNSFPYNTLRTITNPAQLRFPANEADLQPPPFLDPNNLPINASFFVFDRNLRLPYTHHWNATLERAIGRHNAITISYVGAAARRLLRAEQLRNYNEAFARQNFGLDRPVIVINPAVFGPAPSASPAAGSPVSVTRNATASNYNALQMQYRRRLSRGLQALASYTWSKSIDDVSDEVLQGIPLEGYNQRLERGPSDFDIRHTFTAAATYDLPTLTQQPFVKALIGGWSINGIFRARSGAPLNVISQSFDVFNIGTTRRVDRVPGQPVFISDRNAPGGRRLNPAAFAEPARNRQGTLGRNSLRWLAATQWDLSVRRTFNFGERLRLQFATDFFNAFNQANFTPPSPTRLPNGTLVGNGEASSMLGRALAGVGGTATRQTSPSNGFNQLFQFGSPRSIQFSLRLLF